MPLRNQLARGSAWGFFVADLPSVSSVQGKTPLMSVRANTLNPTTKSTPELVVAGERIGGNVCDTPFTYVTTAADVDLPARFLSALEAAVESQSLRKLLVPSTAAAAAAEGASSLDHAGFWHGGFWLEACQMAEGDLPLSCDVCHSPIGTFPQASSGGGGAPSAGTAPTRFFSCKASDYDLCTRCAAVEPTATGSLPRVLVVNDITCGALPYACAQLGFAVDVVSESEALTDASREATAALHQAATRLPQQQAAGGEKKAAATATACAGAEDKPERRVTQESTRRNRAPLAPTNAANIVGSNVGGDAGGGGSAGGCSSGKCNFFAGRVDTEPPEVRKTRKIFIPADDGLPCYAAILFPSALLDAFKGDEASLRLVAHADAIAQRWLLPSGVRLPAQPVELSEEVRAARLQPVAHPTIAPAVHLPPPFLSL